MTTSAWDDHPGYRIDLVPIRATARVRVRGQLVAESERAVRLIETGHAERLYIPKADVRTDLLVANDHTTRCPFKGEASYWSYPDGPEDVLWEYRQPRSEVAGIAGLLGVWHEKDGVEAEIVSRWPDGPDAVYAFPAWGDEDDLLRLLEPQPGAEKNRFVAPGYHNTNRNVVEGGQLLGQALVVAARTVPHQRVTWAATTFARAATFSAPIDLEVDLARRGRTFSTVRVESTQAGRLVAPVTVLADSGADDFIRGGDEMPAVKGPEDAEAHDMGVIGRNLRVVDGAYTSDPAYVGPPEVHAWVRFRDNPAEQCLRQALMTQATTHWSIAAAMAPHPGVGQAMAHESLSTGPVALSVAFHDDIDLDQWFLYSNRAVWSGRGLVQGDGRIWSEGGRLAATYSLQAMVRAMLASEAGKDPSVAM